MVKDPRKQLMATPQGGSYSLVRSLSMTISDLESEDVALLVAVTIATIAALVDTFYGSLIFKALKIISLFLSLGLAYHRIKTSKPYYKNIEPSSWRAVGQHYEICVSKAEHKRGKSPHARSLMQGTAGGYTECIDQPEVASDGDVVVRADTRETLRLEIRK